MFVYCVMNVLTKYSENKLAYNVDIGTFLDEQLRNFV